MWNVTYNNLISAWPERPKFYKGETFVVNGETITLPQSLININGRWCLEEPRIRAPEDKQQKLDRERYLVLIDINARIQTTPLTGNPYTLFKKGKTVTTEYSLARMHQKYQESITAVQQVDGREAIFQDRIKRNGKTKVELVERNLTQQGYMDLFEYIYHQLPEEPNPYIELLQRLIIAYNVFCLLHTLHTQHDRTHGDVKLENIMINPQTGELRFIDYETSQQGSWIRAFQGTPIYAAPEACLPIIFAKENPCITQTENGAFYVSRMVDNFAAGVLLSILVGIDKHWFNRADAIHIYWSTLLNNLKAIGDQQFCLEYQGILIQYKNILDQIYRCDKEREYHIEALFNTILDKCGFPANYQTTQLDETIIINIIEIIMHLTRFDPAQRISLEIARGNLEQTICIVQQIISQQQTVTMHIPTEPVLDKQSQSMDAANNPGTEQQSGLVSTQSFPAQSDMTI